MNEPPPFPTSPPPPPPDKDTSQTSTQSEAERKRRSPKELFAIGLAAVVMLVVIIQVIYYNRDNIAAFGPPKNEISQAINWDLSDRIRGGGQLFQSYQISNKYKRMIDGEKFYIYDYSAVCPLTEGLKTFTGSVALVKRGKIWYWQRNVR